MSQSGGSEIEFPDKSVFENPHDCFFWEFPITEKYTMCMWFIATICWKRENSRKISHNKVWTLKIFGWYRGQPRCTTFDHALWQIQPVVLRKGDFAKVIGIIIH